MGSKGKKVKRIYTTLKMTGVSVGCFDGVGVDIGVAVDIGGVSVGDRWTRALELYINTRKQCWTIKLLELADWDFDLA